MSRAQPSGAHSADFGAWSAGFGSNLVPHFVRGRPCRCLQQASFVGRDSRVSSFGRLAGNKGRPESRPKTGAQGFLDSEVRKTRIGAPHANFVEEAGFEGQGLDSDDIRCRWLFSVREAECGPPDPVRWVDVGAGKVNTNSGGTVCRRTDSLAIGDCGETAEQRSGPCSAFSWRPSLSLVIASVACGVACRCAHQVPAQQQQHQQQEPPRQPSGMVVGQPPSDNVVGSPMPGGGCAPERRGRSVSWRGEQTLYFRETKLGAIQRAIQQTPRNMNRFVKPEPCGQISG